MHAKSVRWPKASQERREAWSLETALRVRDVINPRNRITVVLGLGCGLRQGEAFPPVEVELPWDRPEGSRRKFSLLLTTRFGNAVAVNHGTHTPGSPR
jgi:hypothetical protein